MILFIPLVLILEVYLQLKDIENFDEYSDLITIINTSFQSEQDYIKEELIEKYKKLISLYNENIEIDTISTQNH